MTTATAPPMAARPIHDTVHPGRFSGLLVDPDAPCFDAVPGYRPVVGGVRHLTTLAACPPSSTFVETLCGARYQVARQRWRAEPEPRYDCSFCALALLEVSA